LFRHRSVGFRCWLIMIIDWHWYGCHIWLIRPVHWLIWFNHWFRRIRSWRWWWLVMLWFWFFVVWFWGCS
jgi:hypothetical protein